MVTLAVFLPAGLRRAWIVLTLALTVLLSLNRIAFGAHFLSDVLLSWTMTMAVIVVTYRVLYVCPPAAVAPSRLEASLTAAGLALRRPFARRG